MLKLLLYEMSIPDFKLKASFIIFYGSLLLFSCNRSSNLRAVETADNHKKNITGYTTLTIYENTFIAGGSDGRIDQISPSGKIIKSQRFPGTKINCLVSYNKTAVAAGDSGKLLISSEDGIFHFVNIGTRNNINSLSYFNNMIITGNDDGEIISGNIKDGFRKIYPGLKGNIVSLSSRSSECFGVTDKGEILRTTDGLNWTIFDFNKEYSGFYKPCFFSKVLAIDNRIAVMGIKNDGSPVLLFSTQGNVWTERTLNYTADDGNNDIIKDLPNDIYYDNTRDQFFLVCDNGKLMKIPSCSHCNNVNILAEENLTAISGIMDIMLIAGENYLIKVTDASWF